MQSGDEVAMGWGLGPASVKAGQPAAADDLHPGFVVIPGGAEGTFHTQGRTAYISPLTPQQRSAIIERNTHGNLAFRAIKRAFDIAFSAGAITVLALPGAAICLAIVTQSPGNPLFVDRRVGRFGRPLGVLKFRSMVADADDVEKYFTPQQLEEWQRERKVDHDPRITPIGNWLRRTSLDELPQFVNVLVGQMSVIGPRPITEGELANFGPDREVYLSMRPGITGWWQVQARNDVDFASGERQRMELEYVANPTLAKDAQVFFGTFGAMHDKTGK